MSEKQGFKNAPEITHYAVGMRVKYRSRQWFTVVHVFLTGTAEIIEDDDTTGKLLHRRFLPNYTLDLDSIWVGRRYRRKSRLRQTVTVLMVDDKYVSFTDGVCKYCWCREAFGNELEPLPLSKPDEPEVACVGVAKEACGPVPGRECCCGCEKNGKPTCEERYFEKAMNGKPFCWQATHSVEKDAWKPTAGDKCLWGDVDLEEYTILAIHEDCAWLRRPSGFPQSALVSNLRQIPYEPSVKEAWTPTVREKCLCIDPDLTKTVVTPVVFDNTYRQNWLCYGPEYQVYGIKAEYLRQIPAKPTFIVGDILHVVTKRGYERYGRVSFVDLCTCTFKLSPGSPLDPIFDWRKVSIVKLVPDTLYASGPRCVRPEGEDCPR